MDNFAKGSQTTSAATAASMEQITLRHLLRVAAVSLFILLLATLSTADARVPFDLQVTNDTATLHIDGQVLHAAWPKGITHVTAPGQDPVTRLFQVDGTDISGTDSYNPDTFRAVSSTSYYRFLCWLRDCGSYSQWQDLGLRDDAQGRTLLAHGSVDALEGSSLPTRFTLYGALQRPEVNANLLFTGSASIQLAIGTDPRAVFIGGTSRFYPHDIVPYLAEVAWTLTRSGLWSLALVFLLVALGLLIALAATPFIAAEPIRRESRISKATSFLWPGGLLVGSGILLMVLLSISSIVYQQLPRVYDGIAYYFQAKILSTGNLWVPAPQDTFHLYFLGPFMVSTANGHWLAQYPPGTPMAIAVGMILGIPWAVEPVLGGASALLMAFLAYRWYGRSTALLTLPLIGLSPFYLFLSSSFLSHVIALFALMVFLVSIDLLSTTADWRWAVAASTGAGYGFISRELDTVCFVAPVLVFYAWSALPGVRSALRLQAWRPLIRIGIALAAPFILCVLFYLFYDWRATGSPFLPPREVLSPTDSWGFGAGKGWYGQHTLAAGLFNVENLLTSLLIDLFGWPYYLTLSFFFLPLVTLRLDAHDCLLYALAALSLLQYMGYFYHGIAFGPRYLFVSFPAYALLTSRGIVVATEVTSLILRRLVAPSRACFAAWTSVAVVLIALVSCNISFYLPRQFALYYDYLAQRVDGGLAYDRLHPSWMHNAVVLTDDAGLYGNVLFPLNDPFLKGDVLYARLIETRNVHQLVSAYPRRSLYWLSIFNRTLRFQPIHGLTSPVRTLSLKLHLPAALAGPGFNDLAINAHGDLFVADADTGNILRFDATGQQIGIIATGLPVGTLFRVKMRGESVCWPDSPAAALDCADETGALRFKLLQGQCAGCGDFAFAPNGDIVVAETSESALLRFTGSGRLIARTSLQAPLRQPTSVAVTGDGHVFIYDIERHHTVEFDSDLAGARILPFGSEAGGAYTRFSAAGDWLVGTDPASQSLLAYNVRTKAEHTAAFAQDGTLLPVQGYGLAWDGHRLALGQGLPGVVDILNGGTAPFA